MLRAFYNVCRHRGTAVVEEACGKAVRFQCPYHAWIYDLEGKLVRAKHTEDLDDFSFDGFGLVTVRLETWQGFVFVSLDPEAPPLERWLGDLSRISPGSTSVACGSPTPMTYEVDANWKFIAENYSECYHCPGIHPQLNKLTPYDLGGDFAPDGPWQGGWMELVDERRDDGHRRRPSWTAGRRSPASPRSTSARIYYYLLWPSTFLSIHPDYLLVHRLEPAGAGSHPDRLPVAVRAGRRSRPPDFDPSDAVAFWDLTNRQDWHVCELQHRGHPVAQLDGRPVLEPGAERPRVRSHGGRSLRQRRRRLSRRTVRLRYDVPPPKPGEEQRSDGRGQRPRGPVAPLRGADRGPGKGDADRRTRRRRGSTGGSGRRRLRLVGDRAASSPRNAPSRQAMRIATAVTADDDRRDRR